MNEEKEKSWQLNNWKGEQMGTNIIQLALDTGRLDLAAYALVYAVLLQIPIYNTRIINLSRTKTLTSLTGGKPGAKTIQTEIP
jgi:hypothetical protein